MNCYLASENRKLLQAKTNTAKQVRSDSRGTCNLLGCEERKQKCRLTADLMLDT